MKAERNSAFFIFDCTTLEQSWTVYKFTKLEFKAKIFFGILLSMKYIYKTLILSGLLLSQTSIAKIMDYAHSLVLVEALYPNGAVRAQFLDYFRNNGTYLESMRPSSQSWTFYGACINLNGTPCSKNIKYADELLQAVAYSQATSNKNALISNVGDLTNHDITATTTIKSDDANSTLVEVYYNYNSANLYNKGLFRIRPLPTMKHLKINLQTPTQDVSDRRDINAVDAKLRPLADAVVQLETDPDKTSLLANYTVTLGTGFFISPDGWLISNNHVAEPFRSCMNDLLCEVNIHQTLSNNTHRDFRAKAVLVAASADYDFSLFKVNLPKGISVSYLKFENTKLGPQLLTLGYPADINIYTNDSQRTRLTFSFGEFVGFNSRTYVSNNYIYSGASGSPMLNLDSMSVIGVVSNAVGSPPYGVGSPAISRPIHLIDLEFGISDYLTHKKQDRIQAILEKLKSTSDVNAAKSLLAAFRNEKTFYGASYLKYLMVEHPTSTVRKEILLTLEGLDVLKGKSFF